MEGVVQKRFEVKKWNAVALWAWGTINLNNNITNRYSC